MNSGKKMCRRPNRNLCKMGIGVLAGGLMFVGQAHAGTILSESFEVNPSPAFGAFSSYLYSQNYTSAAIPPAAGDHYYTGDSGLAQSTRTANVALTGAGGLSAGEIDSGLGKFNLSAYFTTYYSQNDWSSVTVQFKDGSSSPVGAAKTIGGFDFVSALGADANGARDWGQDVGLGDIPAGARSADVSLFTQRLAGSAADGYTDLIQLNVSVPEPGSLAWLAAASLLALRRKSRRPREFR